jgi:molybdopterin converting factor small subunit
MKVHILTFGITRNIFGSGKVELEMENGVSISEVRKALEEIKPELRKISSYRIALNQEFADDGHAVNAGDEIALIPPVSGG